MANYVLTRHVTSQGTAAVVLAALETYLETVDDAKTIRLVDIIPLSRDKDLCYGVVLHNT